MLLFEVVWGGPRQVVSLTVVCPVTQEGDPDTEGWLALEVLVRVLDHCFLRVAVGVCPLAR